MPSRAETACKAVIEAIKRMLTILLGVAIGVPLLLALMQDGLIFHPPPAPGISPRSQGLAVEDIRVRMADGVELAGWLARVSPAGTATSPFRAPLAIYFGGNAEEASWMVAEARRFAPWSLLVVNYRGYGGNPGKPGERALFADALALYDWAAARPDVDAGRIVLIGRSLGSGVAVHVAAERKTAGVVLVTPFDSLRAVAQGMYPLIPVSLLLRHPFDSLARAAGIDAPLLVLLATQDRVVAPKRARQLYEAWRGPKQLREFAADHNDIDADAAYWDAINGFLKERAAG